MYRKIRHSILLAIFGIAPSLAFSGYNVDAYFEMQRISNSNTAAGSSARKIVTSYEIGLAEAYRMIAAMNSNEIPMNGKPVVCVTSDDVITQSTISAAIARVIGTETSPKLLQQEDRSILIAQHAIVGLAQLFPCTK